MKANIGWNPNVKIKVLNPDGSIKEVIELKNNITTEGLNLIRDTLADLDKSEIKYMAWGSDDTAESDDDVKLGAEFGRKQITAQEQGSDGEMITTLYMAPYEGNEETIEELGWFGGNSATSQADSGRLIARVLYHRDKTAIESLEIERTDIFSEVV